MSTRRSFLARLLATLPALPFLPRLALAAPTTVPRPVSAAPGIPRQMDLRREMHPLMDAIEVSRHGEKTLRAVAYDLDTDTLIELGELVSEGAGRHYTYRTLHGGVSVRWVDGPR